MSSHFSIRLPDATVSALEVVAKDCRVTRAQVIQWACEAYIELFEANNARMLTESDMLNILNFIRTRAGQRNFTVQGQGQFQGQLLRAAEESPEPGKIIDPVKTGGVSGAGPKTYPKGTRRKSSG